MLALSHNTCALFPPSGTSLEQDLWPWHVLGGEIWLGVWFDGFKMFSHIINKGTQFDLHSAQMFMECLNNTTSVCGDSRRGGGEWITAQGCLPKKRHYCLRAVGILGPECLLSEVKLRERGLWEYNQQSAYFKHRVAITFVCCGLPPTPPPSDLWVHAIILFLLN